jgi:hypothetical protein
VSEQLVLIGTYKGLFVSRNGELEGPHFKGQAIYAVAHDARPGGAGRLLVGADSAHWGPSVWHSDDLGATWKEPEGGALGFPTDTEASLARVWQLQPGGDDEPGVVRAGVEPAALFHSVDGGVSFVLNRGLWDHPHRPQWEPGGGGMCLHTIVRHPTNPQRLWIAVSAAGVYRSDDGGASWQARNQGISAVFMPGPAPEFGQCVHKLSLNPVRPDTLFAQNHWGIFRTDDGGDSWSPIEAGVPSTFGFPIVSDPHDADTAYVIPLESDEYRCTPEGRCRVYRTTDGGNKWEALAEGLPQDNAHVTVLRDGFTSAPVNGSTGLWFGTRGGEVYQSLDGGDSWTALVEHLPPVLCVRAGTLR